MMKHSSVRAHYRRTKKGTKVVKAHVRKVKGVAIPPAWKHIQIHKDKPYIVTGVDEKGRVQYLYSPSTVKRGQERKYKRVSKLESKMKAALPRIIEDAKEGVQEAQVVYTMYKTGFRPGSETDTLADKKAYGAITLKKKHVKLKANDVIEFDFPAKKGTFVSKEVQDKTLSSILRKNLHNENVFQTSPHSVREYFKRRVGPSFHLKDIRTLKASATAKKYKDIKKARIAVSKELSNTPAVAESAYIDPNIVKETRAQ